MIEYQDIDTVDSTQSASCSVKKTTSDEKVKNAIMFKFTYFILFKFTQLYLNGLFTLNYLHEKNWNINFIQMTHNPECNTIIDRSLFDCCLYLSCIFTVLGLLFKFGITFHLNKTLWPLCCHRKGTSMQLRKHECIASYSWWFN